MKCHLVCFIFATSFFASGCTSEASKREKAEAERIQAEISKLISSPGYIQDAASFKRFSDSVEKFAAASGDDESVKSKEEFDALLEVLGNYPPVAQESRRAEELTTELMNAKIDADLKGLSLHGRSVLPIVRGVRLVTNSAQNFKLSALEKSKIILSVAAIADSVIERNPSLFELMLSLKIISLLYGPGLIENSEKLKKIESVEAKLKSVKADFSKKVKDSKVPLKNFNELTEVFANPDK
jgi:hypothetical protein